MKHLWQATRDLHHACEEHPVGAAMASGTPPHEWYAKWMMALNQIHTYVDGYVPDEVKRAQALQEDLDALDEKVSPLLTAALYTRSLKNNPTRIAGAAYVLTGAHLMGGEVMRRRLDGYPTKHLEWHNRKAALAVLQTYREREDIVEEARDCFAALLAVMDEIENAGASDGSSRGN